MCSVLAYLGISLKLSIMGFAFNCLSSSQSFEVFTFLRAFINTQNPRCCSAGYIAVVLNIIGAFIY